MLTRFQTAFNSYAKERRLRTYPRLFDFSCATYQLADELHSGSNWLEHQSKGDE